MKNTSIWAILLVTILLQACKKDLILPSNLTNNPLTSNFDKQVDEVVAKYKNKLNTVGLNIGILKEGKALFYGYGETAKGNNQIPNENTFFEIGSITKTFTAIAAQQWLQEKGLSAKTSIQPFLASDVPPLSKGGVQVTFEHLLTHSSGIPYMPSNFDLSSGNAAKAWASYTTPMLMTFLKKDPLINIPGTRFVYSNTGMGLVGTILATQNNTTIGEYIFTNVCMPLGLQNTKAMLNASEKQHMATGYNNGKPTDYWENLGALDGAGILRSTPSDLLKYATININPPSTSLGKAILACQVPTFADTEKLGTETKIGLSWIVVKSPKDGSPLLFHDGGTGGFSTFLVISTSKKAAVAIFLNHRAKDDANERTRKNMLDELLALIL